MTYDPEHTCGRRIENKLVTREWVAEKLIPWLRTQPNMSTQQIFEFFIHTYQVKLHDAMVFRATKLAKQKCEGEEREQYAMLRDYAHEILRSNPGSIGLDAAIKEVCDGAPHRFCSRHIWANLTKHAKYNGGELRRAFWNCAKASTPQRFTLCMNALRRINQTIAKVWDLTGIPCKHAIAAMLYNSQRPEKFVNPLLRKEVTDKDYEPFIHPISGQDYRERTPDDLVLPPKMKRQPGKPKKQRKKANPHKLKRQLNDLRCGKCGEMRHTKRKYTGQLVVKGKKDRHGASTSGGAPSGSGLAEAENLNVQVEMNENMEVTTEEMNISQESAPPQPS
ncbi:uncharacterized protein LOC116190090 [Punica granatum]|uniref:Uncharacterized protein LOC116190090 n=1 Tax=Punica granatum TaxID=22663 RepID=A0A6P8BZ60_PUNGR|nr:uncharacterized protein LOC116190090 [Punica granatum]